MKTETIIPERICESIKKKQYDYVSAVRKAVKLQAEIVQDGMAEKLYENSPVQAKSSVIPVRKPKITPGITYGQPGSFKKEGWVPFSYWSKAKHTRYYGVRNKQYGLAHLLNFEHKQYMFGRFIGMTYTHNGWMDDIQNWGVKELERRLSNMKDVRF